MALKTLNLLWKFYRNETRGGLILHKFLTFSHYFIFNTLSKIMSRNLVKHIFRNYIRIGSIPLKLTLRDGIIINRL